MDNDNIPSQKVPEKVFYSKAEFDDEICNLEKNGYTVSFYCDDTEGYECRTAIKSNNEEDLVYLRLKKENISFLGDLISAEEIDKFFIDHKDHNIAFADFPMGKAFKVACYDCHKSYRVQYSVYCLAYKELSEISKNKFVGYFEAMNRKPLIIVGDEIKE